MQSKTSFFNRTVYWNTLRRYWVVWVGYAALMVLGIVLPLFNTLQGVWENPGWYNGVPQQVEHVLSTGVTFSVLSSLLVMGPIAALLFSYLYNSRMTGMMNSLPVRRETMFLSVTAAGFTGLLLGDVLAILGSLVVEAVFGMVNVPALLLLLAIMVMSQVLFLGLAVFCCMLTGNIFAGPAVYYIFNFTAVVVEYLGTYLLDNLIYGFTGAAVEYTKCLSPAFGLSETLRLNSTAEFDEVTGELLSYTWNMEGMGVLGIYCAVGVVFLALALVLYRRRQMETAGDVVAIEILKPVFKVCAALAVALVFAAGVNNLLYSVHLYGTAKMVYLAALMVVGGFLGWFIAQMLVEKSLRVFDHGWKGLGLTCLVFVLFLCAGEFDWTGYERRVPDPSQVESVTVNCRYNAATELTQPENIAAVTQLHRNVVNHKRLHEDAERSGNETRYLELRYTMKDGSTLRRLYWLDGGAEQFLDKNSDLRTLETIINTPEAVEGRYILDFYPVEATEFTYANISYRDGETGVYQSLTTLSYEDMAYLYNECIVPDVMDGALGRIDLVEDDVYAQSKYDCEIYLEFWLPDEASHAGNATRRYEALNIYLTTTAARTVAFLEEHGVNLMTMAESAALDGGEYTARGYVVRGDSIATDEPATAEVVGWMV
ncbi:MAG: ABC transporter permease, partial [Oscillospiraceae bacterium]|nr:ABC transporter permease [Oscillospiraceae bacterium]